MTPQGRANLFADEGFRPHPYLDSRGIETIGIGRNLQDNGITREEAEYLADNDIRNAEFQLHSWPTFAKLDPVRQDVFINLFFNMGPKLWKFTKTLAAASRGDWVTCAAELKNSDAELQEPNRINRLAAILVAGTY